MKCNETDHNNGTEMVGSATLHQPYESLLKQALADLQETQEIAQRGGMRLHLTDYHLEAARLALTIDKEVHKQSAAEHIEKAQGLIEATGYKRRLPELEYLQAYVKKDQK